MAATDEPPPREGPKTHMKITRLHAFQPDTPGSPADWRTQLGQIVVQVETDEGLSGLGVGGGGAAGVHLVRSVLADLLVGREPSDVESLQAEMLRHTVFYGRKGIVVMAISGVDLALWDLRGKRAGRSVARLLRDDVDPTVILPTYGTVGDAEAATEAWQSGQRAIKVHVGGRGLEPDAIIARVRRVREMLGDGATLMLDAFATWDVDTTLRVADALAPLRIEWLEEPLPPDDLRGYERLARQSPIPIAGGEHEYTTDGFRTLIDGGLHSVLQPDINWCGGLTTLIEVYKLAGRAGLRVCPHRGSEPFALHAIAALDDRPLAESPRPWFNCLRGAPRIHAGGIQLAVVESTASVPGFGVTLRLDE
jgi:L-rhamnonate dehydratase